jgi:arylsulfatase A-like enzyme
VGSVANFFTTVKKNKAINMKKTRRAFIKQMGFLPLSIPLLRYSSCKTVDNRPNIIFIMADDLGYGHLGCFGQKIIQTPHIDKLSREGMTFTQAYSGCSVCAPSRDTLMTGRHSGHISVRGNGGGVSLSKNDTTIAQILKKAGYATGLFGKWGLGEEGTVGVPNKKGFDEFFGYLHQLHAQFYYPEFLWDNQTKYQLPANRDGQRGQYSHDLIMERASAFIGKHYTQPFFLYLPVAIPHHEFIAPEETLQMYRGKFEENPIDHWRDGYALPKEPKATFAAMVTHLDKSVGKLMALLKEFRIDDNTVVIFTSDNGAAHGPLENAAFFQANGPLRDYKGSLYEGGIRVPMIARWSGHIEPASKNNHVTYFPDYLPTLAELAGASSFVPENIDGLSIVPTLREQGQQMKHQMLYWEDAEYERIPPYQMIKSTFMQAVRIDQWKAVVNSPAAPIELYNLSDDLGEEHDIANKNPQIIQKIKNILNTAHQEAPPQTDMTHAEAARLYVPGRKGD